MNQPPMTEEQRQAAVAKNDARNMDLLVNSEKRLVLEERQILDQIALELGKKRIEARACLNNRSCVIWMEKPERQYKEYFSPEEMELEGHIRELKISAYDHDKYATGQLIPYQPKPPIHRLCAAAPEKLERLFELIGQLSYLRVLDLGCNEWTVLPDSFYTMANRAHLVKLDLIYNKLNSLDSKIGKFTALKILDLAYNRLPLLPETIGHCENLRYLELADNLLPSIPSSLEKLAQLESINLFTNKLTEFPPALRSLKNLVSLDLDDNKIPQIPNWIGEMKGLKNLSLTTNQIQILPEEIFQLSDSCSIIITAKWLHPFFERMIDHYMTEDFAEIKPHTQNNQYILRWKNFIPQLIQKIENNQPLDEWEKIYPYYPKYDAILLPVCQKYGNQTANAVKGLIEKELKVKLKGKKVIL